MSSTYIAREDFLNGIPRNSKDEFMDGAYFGQMAFDSNDRGRRVLWIFTDVGWIDVSNIQSDFHYSDDSDIENIFSTIILDKILNKIGLEKPKTWDSYDMTCRDLHCNDCGIDHLKIDGV